MRAVIGSSPAACFCRARCGVASTLCDALGDGFALYLRRLERGTFAFPSASDASVVVTPRQLAMILGGLDPAKARERPRYRNPV
jgi:transposase